MAVYASALMLCCSTSELGTPQESQKKPKQTNKQKNATSHTGLALHFGEELFTMVKVTVQKTH